MDSENARIDPQILALIVRMFEESKEAFVVTTQMDAERKQTLTRHDAALFGANGGNGLTTTVRLLTLRCEELEKWRERQERLMLEERREERESAEARSNTDRQGRWGVKQAVIAGAIGVVGALLVALLSAYLTYKLMSPPAP